MSKSIVPSVTALELAVDVLARAAAREASASAGVDVLFGSDQKALSQEIRTRAFDLHQVVEFLQGQLDLRHPVSIQDASGEDPGFDSIAVTLIWKEGVAPEERSVVVFSGSEITDSPDPEGRRFVYWTERAVAKYNQMNKLELKLSQVRRGVVNRLKLKYNP